MPIFDNWTVFFEQRLEEFLKKNPQLELQVLLDELTQQEGETSRLITDSRLEEKRLQEEILSIAKDIEKWHERVRLAESLGKLDLAEAAKQKEASLLTQGNQTWAKMTSAQQRQLQSQQLLKQIQIRKQELKVKLDKLKNSQSQGNSPNTTTNQPPKYKSYSGGYDSLDQEFDRLEIEEELRKMKG